MQAVLKVSTVLALAAGQVQQFLPYAPNSVLGSGYEVGPGPKPIPFTDLVPCTNQSLPTDICIRNENLTDVGKVYSRDVRSSSDHNSVLSAVLSAEGGGFGVSVSLGASVMKNSHFTEQSQAFYYGGSMQTGQTFIQNPQHMKLDPSALQTLQTDPHGFLRAYGMRYIYKIILGGTFLGFAEMHSRAETSSSKIDAFADISITKGAFSASGSVDFQKAESAAGSDIAITVNAQWIGGSVTTPIINVTDVGQAYVEWLASLHDKPAAMIIYFRPWMDLEQVKAVISKKSKVIQATFNIQPLSTDSLTAIGTEIGDLHKVEDSCDTAMAWSKVQDNETLTRKFQSIRDNATTHIVRLDTMGEADYYIIQAAVKAADYSWRVSDDLKFEYKDIVKTIPGLSSGVDDDKRVTTKRQFVAVPGADDVLIS